MTEVAYPSAPWHSTGQMWAGLFSTDNPVPVPIGIRRVFSPHWTVVVLVRYLGGTLCYDELAFGAVVCRGVRLGLWVDRMWVDSQGSLWGGRRIWGLPKDMATFTWTDNKVSVADDEGAVATITVNMGQSRLPPIWIPTPYFGQLSGYWAYAVARLWPHLGRSGLRVESWSPRFPYQLKKPTPIVSVSANPFRMTIPAPRLILDHPR